MPYGTGYYDTVLGGWLPDDPVCYCDHCEEQCSEDDLTEIDGEKFVCPNCLETVYAQCDQCDTWVYVDDLEEQNGKMLCQYCRED